MDIVSALPPELAKHIFKLLNPDSLGNVLRVCKKWRELGNDDLLWKPHSQRFRIPEHPAEPICSSQQLCYWALVWINFANSSAYKWHTDSCSSFDLKRSDYTSICHYGDHFTFYSQLHNNLDVFTVTKNTNRLILVQSIALSFPNDKESAGIVMSDKYIVATKYNIILLFKKNETLNEYDIDKAIAFVFSNLYYSKRNINNFIQGKMNLQDNRVTIVGVVGNLLWMEVNYSYIHIININNVSTVAIVTCLDSFFLQDSLIVTWSEEEVKLFDEHGLATIWIEYLENIEEVMINKTILAVLTGGERCCIHVWQLSNCHLLLRKEMNVYTFLKIHPTEDIVYVLEASCSAHIYRITSINVRTGADIWVFDRQVPLSCSNVITSFSLHLVCDRYLVVWPSSESNHKYYVLESETGDYIYESKKAPSEHYCIADTFWVSLITGKKVAVKNYL